MSTHLAAWLGTPELVVILIVVLLLFGGTQIPRLARSLGLGISEFKKGLEEGKKDSNPTDKTDKPNNPPS